MIAGAVLVLLASAPPAMAAFPGQNGKIAFSSYSGSWGVWTMNPDGTGQALLRAGNEPAWSANGNHLLFVRDADIRRMPADGSSETVLLEAPGTIGFANGFWWHSPGWSPDGARIVAGFTDGSESDAFWEEVHVANADGSETLDISPGGGAVSPSWKPDGTEIAYVRAFVNGTTYGIHAVRPDRTGRHVIWEEDDAPVGTVDYSPDGSNLVFSLGSEIYVVSAAGGTPTRLTNNTSTDESPVWSPDGTKIAFESYRDGNSEVYTMNADGTNQTRLTNDPGFQGQPSWQPIPDPGHVRPKLATPVNVSLVPAFRECSAPNRTHGPSLAFPSCNPPAEDSAELTVGTDMSGFVRYRSLTGNPATLADEADIALSVQITDVREQGTLADYAGGVRPQATARLTDRRGSEGGPGTLINVDFPIPTQCTPTAATDVGSTCSLNTTLDAFVPGAISEGQRTVLELSQLQVFDGGADGDTATTPNTVFLRQGVFVP